MSTQAEAADQVVKIMLDGGEHALRIAGAGAKQLAILLSVLLRDQKRTKGRTRLAGMLRSGKELRVFPVRAESLKKFCKEAKKYGVLYCTLRQKEQKDGVVDIMARAEDASKINRIFERLRIPTVDMTSVRSELVQNMEAPAASPVQDPEDRFVEELFSPAPPREQPHNANPTQATGSSPSAPFSRTARAQDTDRPSVRRELERLRREEQSGRRIIRPERIHQPERTAPTRTRRERSR